MDELTNFVGYAVVESEERSVVSVTDTFATAIEAAESYALATIQAKDNTTDSLPILVEGTGGAQPQREGYYGRWKKYDEANCEAELEVFFLRVKPDGILFAGSREERPQFGVHIHETTVELFGGYMIPYKTLREQEEAAIAENEQAGSDYEEGSGAESSVASDDDDEDSDATYKP